VRSSPAARAVKPLGDRFARIWARAAYRSPEATRSGNQHNRNCGSSESNFAGRIGARRRLLLVECMQRAGGHAGHPRKDPRHPRRGGWGVAQTTTEANPHVLPLILTWLS